jgi:hypothetical protein
MLINDGVWQMPETTKEFDVKKWIGLQEDTERVDALNVFLLLSRDQREMVWKYLAEHKYASMIEKLTNTFLFDVNFNQLIKLPKTTREEEEALDVFSLLSPKQREAVREHLLGIATGAKDDDYIARLIDGLMIDSDQDFSDLTTVEKQQVRQCLLTKIATGDNEEKYENLWNNLNGKEVEYPALTDFVNKLAEMDAGQLRRYFADSSIKDEILKQDVTAILPLKLLVELGKIQDKLDNQWEISKIFYAVVDFFIGISQIGSKYPPRYRDLAPILPDNRGSLLNEVATIQQKLNPTQNQEKENASHVTTPSGKFVEKLKAEMEGGYRYKGSGQR